MIILFHKTSINNRNYRETIGSSTINATMSHQSLIIIDDKFKDKPKKRGMKKNEKNKNNSTSDFGNLHS